VIVFGNGAARDMGRKALGGLGRFRVHVSWDFETFFFRYREYALRRAFL
jgi:hypothetical protein